MKRTMLVRENEHQVKVFTDGLLTAEIPGDQLKCQFPDEAWGAVETVLTALDGEKPEKLVLPGWDFEDEGDFGDLLECADAITDLSTLAVEERTRMTEWEWWYR